MSEEKKIAPQEQATIDVINTMAEKLSPQAKMSLMEDIFNTLEPDDMVSFTDFCNLRMGDVITHKAEIAGRMVGKKAGELFDATRKNLNGIANKFSEQMGRNRGDRDKWSDVTNPYDESKPKDQQ